MALTLLRIVIWIVTGICVAVTVMPITTSVQWWVRMWDFPRIHIAMIALLFALPGFIFLRGLDLIAPVALLACAIYQFIQIYPFTPLAKVELPIETPTGDEKSIKLLASNVLMENEHYHKAAEVYKNEDPDILLLMETDDKWADEMADILARFPTVVSEPKDNHYGMIFATRLEVIDARMEYMVNDETPTLFAEMRAPGGALFRFVGLHPRPPVPGQDTEKRDKQIHKTATFALKSGVPVIAMGDFNDVAWSRTTRLFREAGEYLDPRIGRGLIPSFDAEHPIMRFPIDQFYVTKGVKLVSFGRGDYIGSDHFPMMATVVVTGGQ